jgi:ribonuclease HII
MKQGRLHAYEVLLRVAQVREIRASVALVEASAEKHSCQTVCNEITAARDVVSAASRASAVDTLNLDIARYEMLSNLDVVLAQKLHTASHALISAEDICQERATASVVAKRYREQMGERVKETGNVMEQKRSAGRQEEAIELWFEGKAP